MICIRVMEAILSGPTPVAAFAAEANFFVSRSGRNRCDPWKVFPESADE
jgi:hypothetical protein